jgi:hypothetical protein
MDIYFLTDMTYLSNLSKESILIAVARVSEIQGGGGRWQIWKSLDVRRRSPLLTPAIGAGN